MLTYLLFIAPPLLLGLYAQWRVKSAFREMSQVRTGMSGAQAARTMLDNAGLQSVGIELIPGHLSDHYDPRAKVLRLSNEVYNGHSMSAVGVACHEAGHAFQDARQYAPLVIRNMAVPIASFGSNASLGLLIGGALFQWTSLILLGVLCFSAVVFFQLINLPVEFDASRRAKEELVAKGIIRGNEAHYISKVLNAAALTYVAATLQAVMTLVYYLFILAGAPRVTGRLAGSVKLRASRGATSGKSPGRKSGEAGSSGMKIAER